MKTRVILIRHGETDWAKYKRYCGWTDIPLNKNGIKQAKRLCQKLELEDIHKVYSSDMKRTTQFAEIVFSDRNIEEQTALREIDFGIFEGATHKRLMKMHPGLYNKWLADPLNVVIPRGETFSSMAGRVRKILKEIAQDNPHRTIAIVTHAGPIKVILCDVLGLGLDKFWDLKVDLASINVVR